MLRSQLSDVFSVLYDTTLALIPENIVLLLYFISKSPALAANKVLRLYSLSNTPSNPGLTFPVSYIFPLILILLFHVSEGRLVTDIYKILDNENLSGKDALFNKNILSFWAFFHQENLDNINNLDPENEPVISPINVFRK